jgi:hypothetical protein
MARVRDLERVGAEYREKHGGFLPDRCTRSGRKQTRKAKAAIGDGARLLCRLERAGQGVKHYEIALKNLGLEQYEHESNLYRHDAISEIRTAVFAALEGAFWARLEVGKQARKLHVHVLAHQSPKVDHHLCKAQTLKDYAQYLSKCQVPGDNLSAGIFLESRKQAQLEGHKRLPKTSFSRGIPRK